MRTYSQHEAIAQMNALGAARTPFLFIVDYAQEAIVLVPLDQVEPATLRYDFRGKRNEPMPLERGASWAEASGARPSLLWEVSAPSRTRYQQAFDRVMQGLLRGDTFLCNLTARLPLRTNLSLEELFASSHAPYRLWWKERFVCFSPEPFVRIDAEGLISTYPMKGTIDASLPQAEWTLLNDAKEQAEHATIVDLLRNDLSQVARRVEVRRYRYVERIATSQGAILQTSSEIVGQLPAVWPQQLGSLLMRLLPAGSITGAPKAMTQRIIAEAEGYERGYYTGVMGIYDGVSLDSAVMIRFVEQAQDGTLCFKAGGGITAQSTWEREYEEILHKAHIAVTP